MSLFERAGLILFLVIIAILAQSGISIVTWEFWVIVPLILIRDLIKESAAKKL